MKKRWKQGLTVGALALLCLLSACAGKEHPDSTPTSEPTTPHSHRFGAWSVTKAATCVEEGEEQRVCDCGKTQERTIDPLGHRETADEAVAATCTQNGLTAGTHCAVCQTVLQTQQEIPALGHRETEDEAVAATCTESGLTKGTHCAVCKTVLEIRQTVPALGHDFGDYKSNGDATCLENGTETAKCSRCDRNDTRTVLNSALGHLPKTNHTVEPTCITTGLTGGTFCDRCQERLALPKLVPVLGHKYIDGACDRCGRAEIKTSDALAYTLGKDGECYIVSGIGTCTDKAIVIPEIYGGLPVIAVGDGAFANSDITSVTMLNGMIAVGDNAFENCFSLRSVTLPDGIESIGKYAFRACGNLLSIKIPASVRKIDRGAFFFCSSLKGVYITDLEKWCAVEFADFGANPLSMANRLYVDGVPVTDLVISDKVEKISDYAFAQCTALKTVTIGGGTTQIGAYAFYYCDRLQDVTLGENLTAIGNSAFEGCKELQRLALPAGLTSIGEAAFIACGALEEIAVDDANPVFCQDGNCLINSAEKTLVLGCKNSVIPTNGTVEVIADNAFHGCRELKSVIIPLSVRKIGKYAFGNCKALTLIVYQGTQAHWQSVEKDEMWEWDGAEYVLAFQNQPTALTLKKTDITLSPENGTSFDLWELLDNREEFDPEKLICTSADGTVIRVEGTKVIAMCNSADGVEVVLTYGGQSVACLVRARDMEGYRISKTDVTLYLGRDGYEKFKLQLLDRDGSAVKNVKWHFSVDFFKCCLSDWNGETGELTVTAKAATTDLTGGAYVLVWTDYGGESYRCIIRVRSA